MTQGCNGCPPFIASPCDHIEGVGSLWTETSGSFTAEKSDPTTSDTPIGTLISSSAMPGLLDILYHADHLLASTSAPYTHRREDAVYDFELAPIGGFDPDEFQVRGHIAARVDWTIPASPPVGSAQIILKAELRFFVQSAGSPLVGLNVVHDRRINASGGSWLAMSDDFGANLRDTSGFTGVTLPRQEGNFVIDRSVVRGTTQLWFDNELMLEVTLSVPRTPGALNLVVDRADARAQIITVDVPMVELEVELSAVRICPAGTAIPEPEVIRNQTVIHEHIGVGDGATTVFTTNFAYVAGSLEVTVSGILSESDSTDPAGRMFTLADPPPYGAAIFADYRASGL